MAPLLTLLLGSLAARVVGALGVDYVDSWPRAIAVGLAAMFVLTGVAHFVKPLRGDMIAIVPPRLPAPADATPPQVRSPCRTRSRSGLRAKGHNGAVARSEEA